MRQSPIAEGICRARGTLTAVLASERRVAAAARARLTAYRARSIVRARHTRTSTGRLAVEVRWTQFTANMESLVERTQAKHKRLARLVVLPGVLALL